MQLRRTLLAHHSYTMLPMYSSQYSRLSRKETKPESSSEYRLSHTPEFLFNLCGVRWKQCETQLLTVQSSQVKQNSIFTYVKRNDNNSEGVDGHEQCSPNVKKTPNPKQTKCCSIANVRKWDDTYLRRGFFLPNVQILNVAATLQKCKNNCVIKFLAF